MKTFHEVAHLIHAGAPISVTSPDAFLVHHSVGVDPTSDKSPFIIEAPEFQNYVNEGKVEYFSSYTNGVYTMDLDDIDGLPKKARSSIDRNMFSSPEAYFANDPVFVWEGFNLPLRMMYITAISGLRMLRVTSLIMLCWVPNPEDVPQINNLIKQCRLQIIQAISPNLIYVTGPSQLWLPLLENFADHISYTDRCIINPNRTVQTKGKLFLSAPSIEDLKQEVILLRDTPTNLESGIMKNFGDNKTGTNGVRRLTLN